MRSCCLSPGSVLRTVSVHRPSSLKQGCCRCGSFPGKSPRLPSGPSQFLPPVLPISSQDCSPALTLEGSSSSSLLPGREATSPQVKAAGWGWHTVPSATWSLMAPPGTSGLSCLCRRGGVPGHIPSAAALAPTSRDWGDRPVSRLQGTGSRARKRHTGDLEHPH